MKILLVSCSLSPDSRSRVPVNTAAETLRKHEATVQLLDLRDHPLPMCDGEECDPQNLAPLRDAIQRADAILLGVPIYNYDVNAAAKNLVEQTGKRVGRQARRVSVRRRRTRELHVGNEPGEQPHARLPLPDRAAFCLRGGERFSGDEITSPKVRERVEQLCSETARLAKAFAAR